MHARKGGCARAGGYNRQLQIWLCVLFLCVRCVGKLEATQTLEDEVDSTLPRKLESELDTAAGAEALESELDTAAGAEAHVHVDSQRF
jgi:hypothetical protein